MALAEDLTRIDDPRVKMIPTELEPATREALSRVLLTLLQIDCNKQQVKEVYVHFPTPEENKEAARERGLDVDVKVNDIRTIAPSRRST